MSESDRQHGNSDNNRQLAIATSTRPFLAKSRAVGLPKLSNAADAEALIPANLNRSENKPGNQKQTHSARKKAKEARQSKKQNWRLKEANLSRTENKLKPPAQWNSRRIQRSASPPLSPLQSHQQHRHGTQTAANQYPDFQLRKQTENGRTKTQIASNSS
ncbi:hypothetical protein QL285_031459 [Trifolium repens]|nr:hypothetical protein QL285_031459 [Trifolium repens]